MQTQGRLLPALLQLLLLITDVCGTLLLLPAPTTLHKPTQHLQNSRGCIMSKGIKHTTDAATALPATLA
jgi:hypothetical protein